MTGRMMRIRFLKEQFSVCKVADYSGVCLDTGYCWIGRTDEEKSLVCRTEDVPCNATERSDGWIAFRIEGTLDFSLVGILARIAQVLADRKIGIVALSTYDTDYVLIREERLTDAAQALRDAGYEVTEPGETS